MLFTGLQVCTCVCIGTLNYMSPESIQESNKGAGKFKVSREHTYKTYRSVLPRICGSYFAASHKKLDDASSS